MTTVSILKSCSILDTNTCCVIEPFWSGDSIEAWWGWVLTVWSAAR